MKIDIIRVIISVLISILIAYGYYSLCEVESLRVIILCATFFFLAITGCFSIGISATSRGAVMLKTFSGIFFGIGVVFHLIFALLPFNITIFSILDGLLILIYALIAQGIYKAKQ